MLSIDDTKALLKTRESGITFDDIALKAADWPEGPAKELLLLLIDRDPAFLGVEINHGRTIAIERKITAILKAPDWMGNLKPFLDIFVSEAWQPLFVRTFQSLSNFADWHGHRSPGSNAWSLSFVRSTCTMLVRYTLNVEEYIAWHRGSFGGDTFVAYMLATALNNGDEAIFAQIRDILQGEAESGGMSQLHISAFMLADRDDCRAVIEQLLLSAQRQEGLRSSILDKLKTAPPKTILHLLKCIETHDLLRFKSVSKSVGGIFHHEYEWRNLPEKEQKNVLSLAIRRLENTSDETPSTPIEALLALWAQCLVDKEKSLPLTRRLLDSPDAEIRCVALWHLKKSASTEQRHALALPHLKDADKAVVYWADQNVIESLAHGNTDAFETYLQIMERMPKSGWSAKKNAWDWQNFAFSFTSLVYKTVGVSGKTININAFLPFWDKMDGYVRCHLLQHIFPAFYKDKYTYLQQGAAKPDKIEHDFTALETELVFKALQDRAENVVADAIWLFERKAVNEPALAVLEKLLAGKNDTIRLRSIRAVLAQSEAVIQASIERLSEGNEAQRTAAIDLLKSWKKETSENAFPEQLSQLFAQKSELSDKEAAMLTGFSGAGTPVQYSAENGFGLYDPAKRTQPGTLPKPHAGDFSARIKGDPNGGLSMTIEELKEKLLTLEALIIARKGVEYEATDQDGSVRQVIFGGNDYIQNQIPAKRFEFWKVDIDKLPFTDVWQQWFDGCGLSDLDLFILKRTMYGTIPLNDAYPAWLKPITTRYRYDPLGQLFPYQGGGPFTYPGIIMQLIKGFAALRPYKQDQELLLEMCAHIFNDIPPDKCNEIFSYHNESETTWRDIFRDFTNRVFYARDINNDEIVVPENDDLFIRTWELLFWQYRSLPTSDQKACKVPPVFFIHAFHLGLIPVDELYFQMLYGKRTYAFLSDDRLPQTRKAFEHYPFLREMVDRCRARILDIELQRGDMPTAVSVAATHLLTVYGIDYFIRLLKALGDDVFHQGYAYDYHGNVTKRQIMSQLLKRCYPLPSETAADFQLAMAAEKFPEKRLVEAAMYAPQWLPWMEQLLGWPGLQSATWWFHAHANEQMDAQKETETANYSPISAQSFKDGAVDEAWFRTAYDAIGSKHWAMLYDASRYICDNNGHARARLYTDAILGKITPADAELKMKRTRNRDNLVAYGLIPLREQDRDADLLHRYRHLQAFKKESREQSAARKANETEAIHYAFENLARTAGYEDPVRLLWDMEARDAEELMARVQTLEFEGVSVDLVVDQMGKAELQATKKGKIMADLPAKIKKEPALLELRALRDQLREQQGRVRQGLEEAMLRGDEFRPGEILKLLRHPVIYPMLSSLVLISGEAIGFWVKDSIVAPDGNAIAIAANAGVRIAHCTDLFISGQWSAFQRHLFEQKVIQPFKQVFRELYFLTPDELELHAIASLRYEGQQVQPRQAVALLRSRGWTVDYSDGLKKIFARENLVAHLDAYADWYNPGSETPELQSVGFTSRSDNATLVLGQVPARIFSEVMRDVDLVVSVAHAGGVDPEAGLSSIELRRIIVAETAQLFQLDNLTFREHHVLIHGQLSEYSLHLGSGIVHQIPGGMLAIRAVHTQGRGRIFLPFADEDPKTAEIVSKVLLLAKDGEMKDPTVIRQL